MKYKIRIEMARKTKPNTIIELRPEEYELATEASLAAREIQTDLPEGQIAVPFR